MATVVLQYAGAALGTFLGGPVGGIIGRAAGAVAGNIIDQSLFGSGTRRVTGSRLNDLRVMASEEGAAIPCLWGRMRIAGQVIWATNFEEVVSTSTHKASSKGGPKTRTTTYSYYASFAIGLCEGVVDRVGRVWADGKEIDISDFTTRFYLGLEDQQPDSLIAAREGAGNAPAYRGLAYIVFERLPLEQFGNRLPQLSFEVISSAGGSGHLLRAVNIIPGSTEFGYDTNIVTRLASPGVTESENAQVSSTRSDWSVSLDDLTSACRNLQSASLVVTWFGNDLRCGVCEIRPGVENRSKVTSPETWKVAGFTRATAHLVSSVDGKPAFGGTPSDASVIRALSDLKARGLKPVFYPFLAMDMESYPWRGRITCADGDVATQMQAFANKYRVMVIHYAHLCAQAGGVDAFLIGSELCGLTRIRDGAGDFPFVSLLIELAAAVRAILPDAKITYGADWSEYFGYHPADGSGDVCFNLDPLWASPSIDAIGIDNYMPLTDWRRSEDTDLQEGIAGGEGFDWYYATAADRNTQTRTPITDGTYGKPWVFRYKDLKGWWQNRHYNRSGGIESASPTSWIPQSKPIWFTEVGCPAIDKGTNQPNCFYDAKSSESGMPHYSTGNRDDMLQARFLTAVHTYWQRAGNHNPMSSVYGSPMLDASRIYPWAWDARPYPAFPQRTDLWSDSANYATGHWLNGRIGAVGLSHLISEVCARYGLQDFDVSEVACLVDGFLIERPMSARDALENLLAAFAIDAVESDGVLKFRRRACNSSAKLTTEDVVEADATQPLFATTRAQETELPNSLKLLYADSALDYRNAVVEAQKQQGRSAREFMLELPCATTQAIALQRAQVLLQENWSGRETTSFSLAPIHLALEPGDVVTLDGRPLRITAINDGTARKIRATSYAPSVYEPPPAQDRQGVSKAAAIFGQPAAQLMDLGIATSDSPGSPWLAAHASPWPGNLALYRRNGASSFDFNRIIDTQATMGVLLTPLLKGPLHVYDRSTAFHVQLAHGALASRAEMDVLGGANIAAIGDAGSGYEIIQFATAELVAPDTYRVKNLLRGQGGSGEEVLVVRPVASNFILLNAAVAQPELSLTEAAVPQVWRLGPAQLDHGHSTYLDIAGEAKCRGLRPLSPCHLRLRRDGDDIVLHWIRRSRRDGDAWELTEIPLAEESEAYRVEIFANGARVRSADVGSPTYRYRAADIATDFAIRPTSLDVSVAQLSASAGPGTKLMRTLNV